MPITISSLTKSLMPLIDLCVTGLWTGMLVQTRIPDSRWNLHNRPNRLKIVPAFSSLQMRIKVFQMVWISACIDVHWSISRPTHTQQRLCSGHYFAGLIAAWKPNPSRWHVDENVSLAVQLVTDLLLNLQTHAKLIQALTLFFPLKLAIPSGVNHWTAGMSQYSTAGWTAGYGEQKDTELRCLKYSSIR